MVVLKFFSRLSFIFLPLWETACYRLKYYLKGPLNPRQPTCSPNVRLASSPLKSSPKEDKNSARQFEAGSTHVFQTVFKINYQNSDIMIASSCISMISWVVVYAIIDLDLFVEGAVVDRFA